MSRITISIIMPNYNKEKQIENSILSVINQEYLDWELIIIDNYSTDSSISIIQKYLGDARIKLVKCHNDGSIAKSRNIGIRLSKGSYLAFLDSDDTWESTKLTESIKYLYHGYEFVHHLMGNNIGLKRVHSQLKKNKIFINELSADSLTNFGNPFLTSSIVLRKELLCTSFYFDENIELCSLEDFDLWYRLLGKKIKLKYIDKNLGFRCHDFNNTTTAKRNFVAVKYFINKHSINLNLKIQSRHQNILYQLVRSSYLIGLNDYSQLAINLFFISSSMTTRLKLIYMAIHMEIRKIYFFNEK